MEKDHKQEKRMAGEEYLGYRRTKEGKVFHDTPREGRKIGDICTSRACAKSKVRFCNTIGLSIVSKIEEILSNDPKPAVLWSEGCGPQNRNSIFSNALLNLAVKMGVVIEQKFLLKGHTQMECDSVHSNIEEKLKNREIYLPSQYHSITKEARKNPLPYESEILNFSFFKNFSKPDIMAYSSIRPGRVAGDHTVHDLKAIRYNPTGKNFPFNGACA